MSVESQENHPFSRLSPDSLLDAVESRGYLCDGSSLALNSYENRVFQVGLESGSPLIVKFYRPERWTPAGLQEEHDFSQLLAERDLPVVAPIRAEDGRSLFEHDGFFMALYERKAGRDPELDNVGVLEMLGRLLGRMHAAGSMAPFQHRPKLSVERLGHQSVKWLSEHAVPVSLKEAYSSVASLLVERVEGALGGGYENSFIRIHGDLHRGNILWRDDYFNIVDLDDCCMGPAIQDVWMLFSGDRDQQQKQLAAFLKGYRQFFDFDLSQLRWIEALRSIRMVHYAAWLARRHDDPAFVRAFPWFGTDRDWGEHILSLREQLAALEEEPLEWLPE